MKDIGDLKYFFDIEILRSDAGVILNQRKYILELTCLIGANLTNNLLKSNPRLTTTQHDNSISVQEDDINGYFCSSKTHGQAYVFYYHQAFY